MLLDTQHILEAVDEVAKGFNITPYVVGGAVRDLLLGISVTDIDIVIESHFAEFASALSLKLGWQLGAVSKFLTVKLRDTIGGFELDLVTARSEVYEAPGALPTVFPAMLIEDLKRRDFTINSMALAVGDYLEIEEKIQQRGFSKNLIKGKIVDPLNGLLDLEEKCIRILHSASFIDDPTRIFRAFRYLVRIDGDFSYDTEKQLLVALTNGALRTISRKRLINELEKVCLENDYKAVFALLQKYGVLHDVIDDAAYPMLYSILEKASNEQERFEYFLAFLYKNSSNQESFQKVYQLSKQNMKHIKELGSYC